MGSNRAAKTSPEWPVNSMTGDCRAPPCGPYSSCQSESLFSWCAFSSKLRSRTYCSYESTILPRSTGDCNRGAVEVRVRLCALHQLVRAERVVGRAFRLGHFGWGALVCDSIRRLAGCCDIILLYGQLSPKLSSSSACQGSTADFSSRRYALHHGSPTTATL